MGVMSFCGVSEGGLDVGGELEVLGPAIVEDRGSGGTLVVHEVVHEVGP